MGLKLAVVIMVLASQQLQLKPGHYQVYGSGTTSCGAWISEKEKDSTLYHARIMWVLGFVSGAGFMVDGALKQTDSDGITAWMDTYCKAHPLEQISTGAGLLVLEMRKTR